MNGNSEKTCEDVLVFAEEDAAESGQANSAAEPWRILVVDDDEDVHAVTELVLSDVVYCNRRLQLTHAYSAAEARRVLDSCGERFALILLDVVMENEHAGLELVDYIRSQRCEMNTRIILRTGQPGQAPESEVILRYDINDYRTKTELSAQKLVTAVITSLRSYQALLDLEAAYEEIKRHRNQLESLVRQRTGELERTNAQLCHEIRRHEITLEKLEQSEERYRMISALTSDFAYVFRFNERRELAIEWAAGAFAAITGYSPEDVTTMGGWHFLIYPGDTSSYFQQIEKLLAGCETVAEYRIISRSGRTVWLRDIARPMEENGKITAIIGAIQDITDYKHTQAQNEWHQELLHATFEAVEEGIIVIDSQGNIVKANKRFMQLWNLHADRPAAGESFENLLRQIGEQMANAEAFFRRIGELCRSPEEAFDVLHLKDGRVVESYSCPLIINRAVLDRLWAFRDVSRRVQATEIMIRSERLAAIGTIASGVAHEFNNLHAIIRGYAELLLKCDALRQEEREKLCAVLESCDRATAITRDLLTFSRRDKQEYRAAKLSEVVDQTLQLTKKQFETSGVLIQINHEQQPAVRLDIRRMGQVIMNLLINAYQALEGRENKRISITTGCSGERVFVRIADTGCGIAPENLTRIFLPFFTTKNSPAAPQGNAASQGTGLGLCVCQAIVEQHGGEIVAQSEPGQGAVFTVFLPAKSTPMPVESPKPVDAGNGAALDLSGGGKQVLVLDDESYIRNIICHILDENGYESAASDDGEEALRLLTKARDDGRPFDLVISDLQMPKMDGFEFLRRLRNAFPLDPPAVVVITGRIDAADRLRLAELGVTRIITKPFTREHLLRSLIAERTECIV